ncbi:MAG TPA: hypothetical protein VGC91_19030 [Pyrinomonadaceae bacterium]|jgi:hypothetical protein
MYKPNFCAECGAQVVRARWHLWTSRLFCTACARRFRKSSIIWPLIACAIIFSFGLIIGRSARHAPPPLIVEQSRKNPASQTTNVAPQAATVYGADGTATERPTDPNEVVSICGARTKKGTPCSRRVRGTGRCWQHKGMPAMLPPEKLIVKDN